MHAHMNTNRQAHKVHAPRCQDGTSCAVESAVQATAASPRLGFPLELDKRDTCAFVYCQIMPFAACTESHLTHRHVPSSHA